MLHRARHPIAALLVIGHVQCFVTLEDAARHVQQLLPAEQHAPHWQLAVATLIDCAEGRDFLMHARIAMLRALNHGAPGN
jgi:hypothetical protein